MRILQVSNAILRRFHSNDSVLVYASAVSASACRSALEKNGDKTAASQIVIRVIEANIDSVERTDPASSLVYLHAVFFPKILLPEALAFWRLTGLGISSRLAEACLKYLGSVREAWMPGTTTVQLAPTRSGTVARNRVCTRVLDLLRRASPNPQAVEDLSKDDVYLYQTGMAAIYHVHQLLLAWRGTESVVFGFPYELTLKLLTEYGPLTRFYGFGTEEELDDLETYIALEAKAGRMVQAVWCECPSNPLLRTPNYARLRRLADQYGFLIVVDETIGSFANVDMFGVADIVITSLTKSFNGFADVMAGSIILNPSKPYYQELKELISLNYASEIYDGDVTQLELNSQSFLARVTQINTTAASLVDYLYAQSKAPNSTITAVYYPTVCWSKDNYRALMRNTTPEFTPGYGGLFTLEFDTVAAAEVFFDALNVHKGPSLGAHVTLAQPYVQTVFRKEKSWAAKYGLKETIVRISVGLENQEDLLKAFQVAVHESDKTRLSPRQSNL